MKNNKDKDKDKIKNIGDEVLSKKTKNSRKLKEGKTVHIPEGVFKFGSKKNFIPIYLIEKNKLKDSLFID